MSRKERAFRIVGSIIFILAGLWMLNHAVFSFWVSTGPPNDYPAAWHQEGIESWWQAIGLIVIGVFCQFSFDKLRKSLIVKVVFVVILLGLLYPYVREFALIDQCLDDGGSWSEKYFECKNA